MSTRKAFERVPRGLREGEDRRGREGTTARAFEFIKGSSHKTGHRSVRQREKERERDGGSWHSPSMIRMLITEKKVPKTEAQQFLLLWQMSERDGARDGEKALWYFPRISSVIYVCTVNLHPIDVAFASFKENMLKEPVSSVVKRCGGTEKGSKDILCVHN